MKHYSSPTHRSTTLIQRVGDNILSNYLLKQDDRIIVAVSGGADSLALLDILSKLDFKLDLIAVYIDHGLRPAEIIEEKKHLHNFCNQNGIIFLIEQVAVSKLAIVEKRSIEDAARLLRYEALHKLCTANSAHAIATGHTADDQVEEFFIRLIRGSGTRGLGGMQPKRDNIIRPLLQERKQALVHYLEENSITWCTDSSNKDRKFLRNRVRLDLLPLLKKEFNPSIDQTILQSMDVITTEDEFLDKTTNQYFQKVVALNSNTTISVDGESFLSLDVAIQRRIVEKCCWKMATRPTYKHICSIIQLLAHSEINSELHLEGNVKVKKDRQGLRFIKFKQNSRIVKDESSFHIDEVIVSPGIYIFPECSKVLRISEVTHKELSRSGPIKKLYVDTATITFPLRVRSIQPGDRFHPFNRPGHKKISRYLNDKKIPTEDRPRWPLLLHDNKVIAILGLEIDDSYKTTELTSIVLELTWDDYPP